MSTAGSSSSASKEVPFATHGALRRVTGVRLLATGSSVPDQIVRNEDLAALGCDPEWIVKRTGIHERRHAPAGAATSDLAYEAAERCLEQARVNPRDVDLILVATATPDTPMPSTACHLQRRLKSPAAAVDLNAACAGFMYALVTGMQYVKSGCSHHALIIGADLMSKTVNPADKKTYPLFGDGAGAALLVPGGDDQGVLSYTLGADGDGGVFLCQPAGGTREPMTAAGLDAGRQYLHMDGKPVFRWAVRVVADSARDVLGAAGLTVHDIDWFLFHQANRRILDAASEELGLDPQRMLVNLDRYGNTSAASIPLVLDELHRSGKLQRGQKLLLCGFGAGLAWGTAVVRW